MKHSYKKEGSHLNLLGKEKLRHFKPLLKVRRRRLKQCETFVLRYYLSHFATAVRTSPFGSLTIPVLAKHESASLKWPLFAYSLVWNCCSGDSRHQFRGLFSLSKSSSGDADCRGCNARREFAQPGTRAAAPHPSQHLFSDPRYGGRTLACAAFVLPTFNADEPYGN